MTPGVLGAARPKKKPLRPLRILCVLCGKAFIFFSPPHCVSTRKGTDETREPAVHPLRRAQPARARVLWSWDDPDAEPRPAGGARGAVQRRLLQFADLRAVACGPRDRAPCPPDPVLGQCDPL